MSNDPHDYDDTDTETDALADDWDQLDSETPEHEDVEGASSDRYPWGRRAVEGVVNAVHAVEFASLRFIGNIVFLFTNLIPKNKGGVLWKKLALVSFHNWFKQSGGDAIALNGLPNNHVHAEPVKYLDSLTADGKPGWKAKGRDKSWATGADGRDVDYFAGKTPVIWTDDDAPDIGGRFQSRVGECIDLGQDRPLYRNPEFNVTLDANGAMEGGSGPAVADGGMAIQLDSHGVFDRDCIIDLGSDDGFDGMQISWRKYCETYPETVSSEEMRRQEERGRIAEMDPDNMNDFAKKMLMITGGIILVALFIVFGLPALLSGSGGTGGGGGIMPIMLGGGFL